MKNILVAGAAGFIGARTAELLLQKRGVRVTGLDNLNDYYDVRLKKYRLKQLLPYKEFTFHKIDIENREALRRLFRAGKFDAVINLAARAGVRYSVLNPHIYVSTNVGGNINLLEMCREFGVKKFVMASTSSLYAGQKMPFSEKADVSTPISPYAATKKAAEVSAYTYHYLYGIDVSILRYFTVYGPAARPDMSILRFIKWIQEGKTVLLYGDGRQQRDFTHVDDIARGTVSALKRLKFEIINLGNHRPHAMLTMIRLMEEGLGKKAKIKRLPLPKTDMLRTWADICKARKILRWEPKISFEEGIRKTVQWHLANAKFVQKLKV